MPPSCAVCARTEDWCRCDSNTFPVCRGCGAFVEWVDDPDMTLCRSCWENEQRYKYEGWCDDRAKMREGDDNG